MKKQLLILSFILGAFNTYAQTRASDSVLHVKYWNYRQNFLKYLTIVGPDQGMSVPGNKINKWANPMYCEPYRITINSITKKKKRLALPSGTPFTLASCECKISLPLISFFFFIFCN